MRPLPPGLRTPLSGCRRALLEAGAPLPGGLLLCGPPGCGKSSLLRLVGDALRTQTNCQAHVVFISCRTVTADGWDALHKHLTPLVRLRGAEGPCLEGTLLLLLLPGGSRGSKPEVVCHVEWLLTVPGCDLPAQPCHAPAVPGDHLCLTGAMTRAGYWEHLPCTCIQQACVTESYLQMWCTGLIGCCVWHIAHCKHVYLT